jgi:hypothetical protein
MPPSPSFSSATKRPILIAELKRRPRREVIRGGLVERWIGPW